MADSGFADFPLKRRSPFGAAAAVRSARMSVQVITHGTVLQLLADTRTTAAEIEAAAGPLPLGSLRFVGPGQWFLVSDGGLDRDGICRRLKAIADVVDQSHGRARLGVGGSAVRDVLAKGTGVDLAKAEFPIGHAVMTLVGHVSVNLARVGEDDFELLVPRSFAESLERDLAIMSAEFM